MTEAKHTPGPWVYRPYFQNDADIAELRKHGMEPTRALSNDGKAIVSAVSDDDRKPVAHVECQTTFKRGQGHLTDCAERDANARLIAAAPDMLEALKLFLACDEGADLFGLTDKDGGAPGECAPFQSEELERAIDLASAAIAKATGG